MRHRYWRCLFTEDQGAGVTSVQDMQLRESVSGADVTPTTQGVAIGVAIESGFAYASAFDNDSSTLAVVTTGSGAVGYDFGVNHLAEIIEVFIKVRGDQLNQCPKSFQIQYSDNGTSWTTLTTYTNIAAWSALEERVFVADTAQEASGTAEATHDVDGFLDFRNWNQADGAPSAGWTGHGSVVSNELQLTNSGSNGRHNAYADRAESFRQVRVKTVNGAVNGGPTIRHTSGNDGWYVQLGVSGDAYLFYGRYNLGDGPVSGFHNLGSYGTIQMHAKNGLCKVRSLEKWKVLQSTSTAMDSVNGTGGQHLNNGGPIYEDDDLTCIGINMVFNIPTGHKVRIGTRVASESGGVATIDAWEVGQNFPKLTGEILDSSNNLIGIFDGAPAAGLRPAGVIPGDTYTVEIVTVEAPASVTVPHPSQTVNVPFMISWSAVAGADSYEVKYSRNGAAQVLINSSVVGTSINFTPTQTGAYVFYVATNDEGQTSDQTASETVTVKKKGRPSFDTVTILTAGTGNLSGEVTPGGEAKGIIVGIVATEGFVDEISGVTYGGVALTRISFVPHDSTEAGGVYLYFLGSNVPTGVQTVNVTASGTTTNKVAFVFTVIAGSDTLLITYDDIQNASLANPSGTLPLGNITSFVGIVGLSGHNAVTDISPLVDWISSAEVDQGNMVAFAYRYDKVENVDVTFGWTQAADDAVAIGFAITTAIDESVFDISRNITELSNLTELTSIV